MKNVDIVIKIGAKEIIALCIGIPLVYEKLRKIKLKYDNKSNTNADPIIFGEVLIDNDGRVWRREGGATNDI